MADLSSVLPKVQAFLKSEKKHLIGGSWESSLNGKRFRVENPANGDDLAWVAEGGPEDIDRAVIAARKATESGPWSGMAPAERGKLIWKLGDLIDRHGDELAQLESLDNGKPVKVARAADIPLSAEMFRYMAGWSSKLYGDTFTMSGSASGYLTYTLKEPVGVVGQIIPWNFPLLMAAWKLAPALATGCTVVLKPAEQTPLSAVRLGELILEAGFPEGVVNIVNGDGKAGAALAAHKGVDKVAFTGSTETGRHILAAARGNLKKVSLELGGKSPNIIFKDANLDLAVPAAASAIFFNHGQCCCAGSRLFVEKNIFAEVVEGVAAIARKIQVGDGLNPETEMGPLVSAGQYNRVREYLLSGQSDGVSVEAGGVPESEKGYFVQPTVLTGATSGMKVAREEIFGPVVTAFPFSDQDDLIREANNTEFGLAAGVWTQDITKAHQTSARLKAGTTWINCYNVFDASLPFGGYKESGWGREMGRDVLDLYLQTKSVCIKK